MLVVFKKFTNIYIEFLKDRQQNVSQSYIGGVTDHFNILFLFIMNIYKLCNQKEVI